MDKKKRSARFLNISYRSLSLLLKVVLGFLFLVIFIGGWAYSQFPSDKEIRGCLTTKMYNVNLCPTSKDYVKLGQISPFMQKALVLTEDSSFWNHNGFDLVELENSFKTNLERGKFARGGSTITQQLAKNMFLSKDKTLTRKAIEAMITIRMEKVLSKKEILERYLNVVQFGKDLFGIKKAAQFYFNKPPSQLSVVESAFLTLLLPNPEVYSQSFHRKQLTPFAQKRLHQIVDRLYRFQRISEEEYLHAMNELEFFLGQKPPDIDPSEDLNNFEGDIVTPNFEALPGADEDLEQNIPSEDSPVEPVDALPTEETPAPSEETI